MLFAPIPVELDLVELALCDFVAHYRSANAAAKNWKQGGGKTDDRLPADLLGTPAECAGNKGLGLTWDPYIDPNLPDGRWHIQFRGAPPWGRMIIRPKDDPRDDFVLVTGCGASWEIQGWLEGWRCHQTRWLFAPCSRSAAWFVPRSALHRNMSRLLDR